MASSRPAFATAAWRPPGWCPRSRRRASSMATGGQGRPDAAPRRPRDEYPPCPAASRAAGGRPVTVSLASRRPRLTTRPAARAGPPGRPRWRARPVWSAPYYGATV